MGYEMTKQDYINECAELREKSAKYKSALLEQIVFFQKMEDATYENHAEVLKSLRKIHTSVNELTDREEHAQESVYAMIN